MVPSMLFSLFSGWEADQRRQGGVDIFKVIAGTEIIIYIKNLDLLQTFGENCEAILDG